MIKLKGKQPPQPEAPVASLAARIEALRAETQKLIDEYIDTLKAASPLQPRPWHEMDLRLRFGRCNCDCALKVIEAAKK
jgi:hypothetical protein